MRAQRACYPSSWERRTYARTNLEVNWRIAIDWQRFVKILSNFCQNFSQMLTKLAPPIAREGAFFSVFRDLHDFRIFSRKLWKFCWNFCDFQKNLLNFLKISVNSLNFDYFSNIFQEKSVNSCRFWKMLKNAPFLITIGVDTAENEPRKGWYVVARTGVSILRALGP